MGRLLTSLLIVSCFNFLQGWSNDVDLIELAREYRGERLHVCVCGYKVGRQSTFERAGSISALEEATCSRVRV